MLVAVLALLVAGQSLATDERAVINGLLDNWHHAASVADEKAFFGLLDTDAIYLGTDASERWTKSEFREWARPHFQRESAWTLEPHDRTVYLSGDGRLAWFEEYLDTRMGDCRGSGVMVKTRAGWKLSHYDLALTVPNDKIDGLIELISGSSDASVKRRQDEIRQLIERLFDGMRAGHGVAVRSVFASGATITRTDDETGRQSVTVDEFVSAVRAPRDKVWDERIWDLQIRVDGDLASAWAKYAFYVGADLSHCGVDSFELLRDVDGWKIVHLLYTRRHEGCSPPPEN